MNTGNQEKLIKVYKKKQMYSSRHTLVLRGSKTQTYIVLCQQKDLFLILKRDKQSLM